MSDLKKYIAMLILRYLQIKASFPWSLSNLVALLRMNLWFEDFTGSGLRNTEPDSALEGEE
ncbi:MAG: hypothetical protein KJ800_05890 [Proteobacteria bacterium]|nr:hypothetical protein [Pseudomonadota bacterium]